MDPVQEFMKLERAGRLLQMVWAELKQMEASPFSEKLTQALKDHYEGDD